MSTHLPKTFLVTSHTDYVGPGSTFVAIQGVYANGIDYIPLAIEKGASIIIVQNNDHLSLDLAALIASSDVTLQRVNNTRKTLAIMSAQAYGYPAKKLKIIGVTGTKGKTTTVHILEHILNQAGKRTALLSTVGNRIAGQTVPGALTTPLPDYLHPFLHTCVEQRIDTVVMKVPPQALSLHRLEGIEFSGIIFSNFAQEHAEFYATMDDYFQAKCHIFDHVKPEAPCVINIDDPQLYTQTKNYPQLISYALEQEAQYRLIDFETSLLNGSKGTMVHQGHTMPFTSPLVGTFNGYNILGAAAILHQLGISWEDIANGIERFGKVPGRFETYVLPNGAYSVIDYAHTPSSFTAILSLLKAFSSDIIVVFGCGGDRDHVKRPFMGEVAATYTRKMFLTTDNPRSEDPADIVAHIMQGIPTEQHENVYVELDRKKAIEEAYRLSKPGTIIALLGKGPDEYQLITGKKTYFSEHEILAQLK